MASIKKKAVIDLVTGFLGAGKTTFISGYGKWLRQNGVNFKIIENEFGMAGVDTSLLKSECFEVSELVGGCICCTMKSSFADTIIRLSSECERIIVEPSGIFSLDDYFEVVDSAVIKEHCETGAVITIIDPYIIDKLSDNGLSVLLSQLHSTGRIVLSKTKGLGQAEIDKACEWLLGIMNSYGGYDSKFICSKEWNLYNDADYELIMNSTPLRNSHENIKIEHGRIFNCATFYPQKLFTYEEANSVINEIMDGQCGDVIRIKGNIRCLEGTLTINSTPSATTITESRQEYPAVLNIIGSGLLRKKISQLLQ